MLLVHFKDEPYEDFNTASNLEYMVCMYCQSYKRGRLNVTTQNPMTHLSARYKDLIANLRVDISYVQGLCDDYEHITKEYDRL